MRRSHFEALAPICPSCAAAERERALELATVVAEEAGDVVEGVLRCSEAGCQSEYPILDGLPFVVPNLRQLVAREVGQMLARDDLSATLESLIGDCCGPGSAFDTVRQQLSSYGWDHWGDRDPEEPEGGPGERPGSVVRLMAEALERVPGRVEAPVLELGCSVGRVGFELAARTDGLVVGADLNVAMLRLAARVLRRGTVRYPRRRVGLVYDLREFRVTPQHAERVDFWVCDGTAPPFGPGRFGTVVALNFLDSVASPLAALESVARLLAPGGLALLACPYDWSPAATPVESWVGGHSQRGRWQGSSDEIVRALLTPGGHPASLDGLEIVAEEPDLAWRVRLHDRSAVDYRCHLIVARKRLLAESSR